MGSAICRCPSRQQPCNAAAAPAESSAAAVRLPFLARTRSTSTEPPRLRRSVTQPLPSDFLPAQPKLERRPSAAVVEALHRRASSFRDLDLLSPRSGDGREMRTPRGKETPRPYSQKDEKEMRLVFDCLDLDCNGVISLYELAAVCTKHRPVGAFLGLKPRAGAAAPPNGGAVKRAVSVDQLFEDMDYNGDGVVSWGEFCRFVAEGRRSRNAYLPSTPLKVMPPPPALLQLDDEMKLVFDTCDANGNGRISLNELMAVCTKHPHIALAVGLAPGARPGSRGRAVEAVFTEMDLNRDRQISPEEFCAFMSRLREARALGVTRFATC